MLSDPSHLLFSLLLTIFTEKGDLKQEILMLYLRQTLKNNYVDMSPWDLLGRTLITCLYQYIFYFKKHNYKQMLFFKKNALKPLLLSSSRDQKISLSALTPVAYRAWATLSGCLVLRMRLLSPATCHDPISGPLALRMGTAPRVGPILLEPQNVKSRS